MDPFSNMHIHNTNMHNQQFQYSVPPPPVNQSFQLNKPQMPLPNLNVPPPPLSINSQPNFSNYIPSIPNTPHPQASNTTNNTIPFVNNINSNVHSYSSLHPTFSGQNESHHHKFSGQNERYTYPHHPPNHSGSNGNYIEANVHNMKNDRPAFQSNNYQHADHSHRESKVSSDVRDQSFHTRSQSQQEYRSNKRYSSQRSRSPAHRNSSYYRKSPPRKQSSRSSRRSSSYSPPRPPRDPPSRKSRRSPYNRRSPSKSYRGSPSDYKRSNSTSSRHSSLSIRSSRNDLDRHREHSSAKLDDSDVDEKEPEVIEGENSNFEEVKASWVRSSPSELFYYRDPNNMKVVKATQKLIHLCNKFEDELVNRAKKVKKENMNITDPNESSVSKSSCPVKNVAKELESHSKCKEMKENCLKKCDKRKKGNWKSRKSKKCRDSSSSSSSDSNSDSCLSEDDDDWAMRSLKEMEKKQNHPDRLHKELWSNDLGEMNDGPVCRCSLKAKRSGIRHGYFSGEEPLTTCDAWSNNADKLYHYLVAISPPTNFLVKSPTIINHDNHEFIFEGFSLFSHHELSDEPTCQVIRFNIEYSMFYVQEQMPENYCIKELDLFFQYFFTEILELVDLNFRAIGDIDGCPRFHFMPRFVRPLPDNGKEVLSMNEVLRYLLKSSLLLISPSDLPKVPLYAEHEWLNYTDQVKGMIVTYPGKKPCSIRVDQVDRDPMAGDAKYPVIVHFGIRPPQLSYAGNPAYQKALRDYVKFRHLLANMPKPSFEDKRQLEMKENHLQEMRMANKMKRDVTVDISAEGFYRTGVMCDIVQHALLIPVLVRHLRFHRSLNFLEEKISYKFKNRSVLQLALTHPSYRENFGTNPDHARNSLTNCGIRQPEYGDRKIHFMNTHKRGINTLVNIMSRFGKNKISDSKITHNERLEFLGDAIVEFLSSIHLFHLFPNLEEGGLATYRAAVVQNQHLSVLAEKLELEKYVLHAHGSDLCHTFEIRHAMANCFEALMGAIFIDSGIEESDVVFSSALFRKEEDLHSIWSNYRPHPLQEQEPEGDRRWIETYPILQKLSKFEESIGITFNHIRILARCFTDRSIGFNYLTLGSNQRLEFLGDTVLQLVASEYLYKFFPEHHEGHLSLLRSSLVNNRTQAVVCDDLNMTEYAMYSKLKVDLKTKDRADLLEAFLGALYIDQGLNYCRTFCQVCFFPRLQQFIINQEWNDPKSKLQQCCLTLRTMEGGEPDIPIYKVIECKGPTNTRIYTVAVYFKEKRLAKASGHSIQQAEMNAAKAALAANKELFPQLEYQRKVIEKNIKCQSTDSRTDRNRKQSRSDSERQDRNRKQSRSDSERQDRNRKQSRSDSERQDQNRKESLSVSECSERQERRPDRHERRDRGSDSRDRYRSRRTEGSQERSHGERDNKYGDRRR